MLYIISEIKIGSYEEGNHDKSENAGCQLAPAERPAG
jgi:hypothetical protein